MLPRLFVPQPFVTAAIVALPAPAARHVQVLRLQPGQALIVFNGSDGADWPAEIVRIGRSDVDVRLGVPLQVDRELACAVTIAVGVPANDRMDALVEKASELGAAAIQPLVCERSVVRLSGDRAEARRRHWQGVAAAASEQCGRARVAEVLPLQTLASWLGAERAAPDRQRLVLSLGVAALTPSQVLGDHAAGSVVVLSGPEGGLTPEEEGDALRGGFLPVGLGPRTLRADTAPLALLAWIALGAVTGREKN